MASNLLDWITGEMKYMIGGMDKANPQAGAKDGIINFAASYVAVKAIDANGGSCNIFRLERTW